MTMWRRSLRTGVDSKPIPPAFCLVEPRRYCSHRIGKTLTRWSLRARNITTYWMISRGRFMAFLMPVRLPFCSRCRQPRSLRCDGARRAPKAARSDSGTCPNSSPGISRTFPSRWVEQATSLCRSATCRTECKRRGEVNGALGLFRAPTLSARQVAGRNRLVACSTQAV